MRGSSKDAMNSKTSAMLIEGAATVAASFAWRGWWCGHLRETETAAVSTASLCHELRLLLPPRVLLVSEAPEKHASVGRLSVFFVAIKSQTDGLIARVRLGPRRHS